MQLTQKQESMISRFLRDLAAQLDDNLPEKSRERSLRQIQMRIYKELEGLPNPAVTDEDVVAALRRATPQRSAPTPTPSPSAPPQTSRPPVQTHARRDEAPPPGDEAPAAVWLGVCAFNADRFGVAPWMVRLGAVVLGLVTGPIALFCYLAGYVEYYLALEKEERPEINYATLAIRGIGPLFAAIFLRWGAYKVLDLIAYGYQKAFSEAMPAVGKWDWLANYDGMIYFLICGSIVPISILSGLPLANAWGHSLKRLAQALVALYFVCLSFGIASVLVGIILGRVEPYMQQ